MIHSKLRKIKLIINLKEIEINQRVKMKTF